MRLIRQIIAAVFILAITLHLCDFAYPIFHSKAIRVAANIQLIPALLAGSFLTVAILILCTCLFGRIYCSTLCPLGILQDIVMRLSKWTRKKRQQKSPVQYKKPRHILRYSILGLSALVVVLGSSYVLIWLDPYSIYTRLCSSIIQPLAVMLNNSIADIANAKGNYSIVPLVQVSVAPVVIISTLIIVGTVVYFSVKHNRLWCNTICPVGTLLGLISKYSYFKIRIDHSKCVSCKACAKACKSNTIDHINDHKLDHSRCVTCYNCIGSCKKNAISYTSSSADKTKC